MSFPKLEELIVNTLTLIDVLKNAYISNITNRIGSATNHLMKQLLNSAFLLQGGSNSIEFYVFG